MKTPHLVVGVAAALWACSAFAADCERRIAPSGPAARTVVLAGGDSWTLFKQFLAEIEQRDLDVSLWKTEVQISREGRTETYTIGWTERFTSDSAEQLWERNLRGKRAELNPQLLANARAAQRDVVCVGGTDLPPPRQPSEALVFYKNGLQYASRGDYANALNEFKAAEKLAPRFEGLAMNLGVTYLQLKDYVRASEYLTRAIAQKPKDPMAHYNMACLQARLGQHDQAIASLKTARAHGMQMTAAVQHDPDLTSLHGRTDFKTLFEERSERP